MCFVGQIVAEADSLPLPGFAVQELLFGLGFIVGKLPAGLIGPAVQKLCEYQVSGCENFIYPGRDGL